MYTFIYIIIIASFIILLILVLLGSGDYFTSTRELNESGRRTELKTELLPADSVLTDSMVRPSNGKRLKNDDGQLRNAQTGKMQTKPESAMLRPAGEIFLLSEPASEVYIDQQYRGKTPFQNPLELSAGNHELVLSHNYYPDFRDTITIAPGETNFIGYALDTLFGYLSCQIYPWGMVLVDGALIGETPLPHALPLLPGRHSITIENPAHPVHSDSLIITKQETTFYRMNLEKITGEF